MQSRLPLLTACCFAATVYVASTGDARAQPAQIFCEVDKSPNANTGCGVAHSTDPEGWVRAAGNLTKDTGLVHMWIELESDSVWNGPCGRVKLILQSDTETLANVDVGEICRKGKKPGRAVDDRHRAEKRFTVDLKVARATKRIAFDVSISGASKGRFDMNDVKMALEAAAVVIKVIAALQ